MDSKIKKYCPNCSQLYVLQSISKSQKCNLPLFLSCGHSMCEKCITNIVKFGEPIECKVCQNDTQISASALTLLTQNKKQIYQYFPINTFMIGELALELLENPENKSKKSDDDYYIDIKMILTNNNKEQGKCVECCNPTSKMCQQCDTILCDSCFNKSHSNFVIFKNHVLKSIETPLEANNCKNHSKPLDYYCKDCSKALCMDCLMVGNEKSCKNHNVVSMQETNQDILQDLGEITPKIHEIFKRLTKSAVDVGNLLHHIENETGSESELTKIIPSIDQNFSKLCYIIQKHKKEIFDTVIKLKNSEKFSLQSAKESIADSLKKINKVMKMIDMTKDANNLKQINLSQLFEAAKEVADAPWFLKKDNENKDNLKLTVNEDLCTLLNDYIHLEGNASCEYKLKSMSELGDDVEIPPPPTGLVYPPELPKDVRQLKKTKTEVIDKDNQKGQAFHKLVPKYRLKSGSTVSLNSCDSGDSYNRTFISGETYQRPVVQPVSPFAESQYPKHLQEGTQELIYISHIIDPHNFYVQRACHQRIVKEMMNEFRNAISLPKPSLNHVAEGKIYLAFHKADNMWQRCRVVNIDRRDVNKPIFRVFCIDFGSSEVVTIDKLRLLPPARVQSPYPLAINCSLANCVPKIGTWTNDDAFLIQNIVDNKQAVMHIRNIRSTSNHYTMQIECDITTVEHGVSIAHALVFHERAKMPNPRLLYIAPIGIREKPKIYVSNDNFKPKSVEDVYMTHIVSPDNFFVRKVHHQNIYEKLCDDMEQEYSFNAHSGTVYLPEIGMVCVANVEKYRQEGEGHAWARGIVREVLGRARVNLLLPDTGELLLLHYSALRYINPNFTVLNALATECHLAGITPLKKKWSPGSVSLLRRFENRLLKLHVDENRNRGSLGVTLYDNTDPEDVVCINYEMIKHKFAVTFGIFNFNKHNDTPDEIKPVKTPAEDVKKDEKPLPKRGVLVKRRTPKSVTDEDLEVKDKGPLRLEAKILNYQSPSLIYMSLVHQQKTFNELFENIQRHYAKAKNEIVRKWELNDKCCTLCAQSQTWRRAVILEIQDKLAKVFYSDFASIETVPLSLLRELTSDFASIGNAAIKCHLTGVMPAVGEEWPSLTKEYLKELLDAYKRVFITKIGNFKDKSMPIEIWVYHTVQGGALEPNKSEWRCLNNRIIEQGLAVPDKSHEVNNPNANPVADDEMLAFLNVTGSIHDWLLLDPMPVKPLEGKPAFDSNSNSSNLDELDDSNEKTIGKSDVSNVMFISDWLPPEPLPHKEFTGMPTYIDNDGIIYLHDISQQDTLDIIRKALDVRFKDPDPKAKYAKWTVGEPCIALFFLDNRFYRGKVVEVNEEASTCLIHYIDYGNEEQCSFTNLRKSIALHQIPTQATKCILNRIEPKEKQWDRQTLDYIHKSIVEKQCYVKVVGNPIDGITPIELKYNKLWINDHLVEFEMAEYCDGSKAVVRKFAPENINNLTIEPVSIESDSGPDFIVEEDAEGTASRSTSRESLDVKDLEGKDWNELLQEDNESLDGNYITYPKYDKDSFKCNICLINDPYTLQLNIHDSDTEVMYEEIFARIQSDGADMPPLSGIFENKACVALYPEDGLWYRASILEFSESKGKVKVRYVDFGNIEVINLDDVREAKDEWVMLPPLTVAAKLDGVKLNTGADVKAVIEEYKNILLDKGPFDVRVIKYVDSIPFVDLRKENGENVNEVLIGSKLFSPNNVD